MKSKLIQIEENMNCPECKSKELKQDDYRGELVCQECGLVIDENQIDYRPEWRAYNQEEIENKSRTGPPKTQRLPDKGLSTTIDWKNRDIHGNTLSAKSRSQFFRLRRWQKRIRNTDFSEKTFRIAVREIERLSSAITIPKNVRETAIMIYRKAAQRNLIRGRSVESIAAAALYAASRECNMPRTLDEVKDESPSTRKEIGRTYRFLARELGLKIKPTTPKDYLIRFCNKLKLGQSVKEKANEIINKAIQKGLLSGRGPISIAAASIYIASVLCQERKTQKEISKVSGVTEVTIRNRYKEISNHLGLDIESLIQV